MALRGKGNRAAAVPSLQYFLTKIIGDLPVAAVVHRTVGWMKLRSMTLPRMGSLVNSISSPTAKGER
jgi:hypothetical protein